MNWKYNVKDWRKGIVTTDYNNGKIENIDSCKKGNLPYELYSNGLINEANYLLIRADQKDAFFKAVDLTVNTLVEDFKYRLENAPNSKGLLDLKIEELRESFNSSDNHIKQEVFSGDWDPAGIDFVKYVLIKYPEKLLEKGVIDKKPSIIHLSKPSTIVDGGREVRGLQQMNEMIGLLAHSLFPEEAKKEDEIPKPDFKTYVSNYLYDQTVNWKFLRRLEALDSDNEKNNNQNNYGIHQENRNWIMNKFREKEPSMPSQNKTVEEVQRLYKDKFGKKIGKTTILRFLGRAD